MRNRVGPIGRIITGHRQGLGALALLPAMLLVTGCDDQLAKNLSGRSGENRTLPQSTAFYTAPLTVAPVEQSAVEPVAVVAPVEPVAAPATPEPIAEVIAPPEPICVPKFREPCPGDE